MKKVCGFFSNRATPIASPDSATTLGKPLVALPAQLQPVTRTVTRESGTVAHQPGPGRTLNRIDTWLGRNLERAFTTERSELTPTELPLIPRTFIIAEDGEPEPHPEPLTRTVTIVSETVEEQRGLGRTLNRFDRWLGRTLEMAVGRVVAILLPTPQALQRRIAGILDTYLTSFALEDQKITSSQSRLKCTAMPA